MSKHRAPGNYDPAHETAVFLAEVAVNMALEEHGFTPMHPVDVATAMIHAIEDAPAVLNGHPTRPQHGTCPGCGASEQQWCYDGCNLLDPMDYR